MSHRVLALGLRKKLAAEFSSNHTVKKARGIARKSVRWPVPLSEKECEGRFNAARMSR
jgi:hypothetical protein